MENQQMKPLVIQTFKLEVVVLLIQSVIMMTQLKYIFGSFNNLILKYVIIFVFILAGCSPKPTILEYNNSNFVKEDILINEFKGLVFKSCIKYGFNNSDEIKSLHKNEKSYVAEIRFSNLDTYKYIDTLAIQINAKISQDSILSFNKYKSDSGMYDYMIGKKVYHYCLKYYASSELDSIARARVAPFIN